MIPIIIRTRSSFRPSKVLPGWLLAGGVPKSRSISISSISSIKNLSPKANVITAASQPITREARIICIADPSDDDYNSLFSNSANKNNKNESPDGAQVVAVGSQISDFDVTRLKGMSPPPNVILVYTSHETPSEPVASLLQHLPSIEWMHSLCAGIDHINSDTLASRASSVDGASAVTVTNAKGCYSSALAEYTMMSIAYFAKDLPRLLRNKKGKNWEKYSVEEIRGKTLGIVGYGDIGQAAAKLAKAYGMKIIALKRKRLKASDSNSLGDDDAIALCDEIYYGSNPQERTESLHRIMSDSDYVLCAAPLTPETKHMLDKDAFAHAKKGSVFINVGRGPVVDENALIDALKSGKLKGAGLDTFEMEPLTAESEFWKLENVLTSPHNMYQSETFQHESTDFFVDGNLPRFLRGEMLLSRVDVVAGY